MPEPDPREQQDKPDGAQPDAQRQPAPPEEDAGVPLEQWSVERPFDSAEYLDRPEPEYEDAENAQDLEGVGGEGEPGTLPPDPDPAKSDQEVE